MGASHSTSSSMPPRLPHSSSITHSYELDSSQDQRGATAAGHHSAAPTPHIAWPSTSAPHQIRRTVNSSVQPTYSRRFLSLSNTSASSPAPTQASHLAPPRANESYQPLEGGDWSDLDERLLLASVKQRGEHGQWHAIVEDINVLGGRLHTIEATKQKYEELKALSAATPRPTPSLKPRYRTQSAPGVPSGSSTTSPAPPSKSRRSPSLWSSAQDALLLAAVRQHGQNWEVVASQLSEAGGRRRTGSAARGRYFKIIASSAREADARRTASASSDSAFARSSVSLTRALAGPSGSSTPRQDTTSQTEQAVPIGRLLASPADYSTMQAAPRGNQQAKQA